MTGSTLAEASPPGIAGRTTEIFAEQLAEGHRMVDRLFAIFLLLEWVALILVAVLVSPWAWSGEVRDIHVHVWAATVLGGVTVSLPVAFGLARPGRASTRLSVAVAQSLLVALLIHLTGGRPEAHFHAFVTLAILAFYRDWRVLATAGLVIALDHYYRGVYWPRSVFGPLADGGWRWAEHGLWVGFEVAILCFGLAQSRGVLREAARRRAEVEATRDRVEAIVDLRTAELRAASAGLEDRVFERTAQLRQANDALRGEIAERLKAEDQLRASEERFRTLAEALPQMVWKTDADGVTLYFNARWYEYSGLSPEASLGFGWLDVLHPDDRERTREVWSKAVSTGLPYQIEYRMRRGADRSYRWQLARGLPIRDEAGAIDRWFGTCTDIHDQKEAAEALRRAHDELEDRVRQRTRALERANSDLLVEVAERRKAETEALLSREAAEVATRAKSQFLANMSHEIRTPMNAIIGMTEVTLGLELPPEPRENLEVVRVAADALLVLIDDILDFSKVEAGRLDLEPIRFRPREAVDAALKTIRLGAEEKGLALSASVDPAVPDAVVGDPLRLRQVLLNLLGNAVKFTSRGRVQLRVAVEGVEGGSTVLRFSVLDDGIGIDPSRLSMIFDPFSQADGSTTRRFGGTGLGLTISARLAELMGGRIWVESEVGRGSVFHFTARFAPAADLPGLPGDPSPRPGRRAGPPPAGRRLRVLLVDDNALNRRVGLLMLRRLGHEVQLASGGPEAVARYEGGGPFDLVLMDVQMPEMDGFRATALIREVQEMRGRRCPIVALTAFATTGDRERCLRAGMDEHLAKPIRADDLARALGRVLEAPDDRPAPRWCLEAEEIRSAFPMGVEEMGEVVGIFRENCAEELARLARAVADDDAGAVSRGARELVTSLAMFGSSETVGLAAGIEEAGRSGDLAAAADRLAELEAAIAAMQATLDELAGPNPAGAIRVSSTTRAAAPASGA